jgi:hypothetical protein
LDHYCGCKEEDPQEIQLDYDEKRSERVSFKRERLERG